MHRSSGNKLKNKIYIHTIDLYRYTPDPTSFQITKPFENASQNKEDSGSNENDNYLIPKSRGQPQYLELINECDSNGDLSHSSPKSLT